MPADLLCAIGARIVPGLAKLTVSERVRVFEIIEAAIAARPSHVRRQFRIFLALVRWLPIVRYGRRFERLSPRQQDAVLRAFQDAPLAALRQGFWGLKTLIYMGYYGRPEIGPEIGYRPSRQGNTYLHAR